VYGRAGKSGFLLEKTINLVFSGENFSREKACLQQKFSLSLSQGFLSFLGEKFSLFSSTLRSAQGDRANRTSLVAFWTCAPPRKTSLVTFGGCEIRLIVNEFSDKPGARILVSGQ